MTQSGAHLIPMWREVLGLCQVKPQETVVVLTGPNSNPLYIEAATHAALDLDAKVFRLDLPPVRGGGGMGSDPTAYLGVTALTGNQAARSEEHTSELQSRGHLVCRLLLE